MLYNCGFILQKVWDLGIIWHLNEGRIILCFSLGTVCFLGSISFLAIGESISYPPCSLHIPPILLSLIWSTYYLTKNKIRSYSTCNCLRHSVTSFPLGENILLSPQFSSPLDLSSPQDGKSSRESADLNRIGYSRQPTYDSIARDSVWVRSAPRTDEARWICRGG
jgi:hypothetical protein